MEDLRVEFLTRGASISVLNDLSFKLRSGATLALVGESGSGKTVTGLAVMRLLPRRRSRIVGGQVRFENVDLASLTDAEMRKLRGERISMIFQDPLSSLNPVLNVGRQIGEAIREHRDISYREARAEVVEILRRVGIPDAAARVDDYPHQFSGGMRQRVLIAMGIVLGPRLLIADEPTTALDVTVQVQILQLLHRLTDEGEMGLILITHDLGVAAHMARDIVVMYAGTILEKGPAKDVIAAPSHPYTVGLVRAAPRLTGRDQPLASIPGQPPSPMALPRGCVFQPRCYMARDICRVERPPLQLLDGSRASACHFAAEVRGGLGP